MTSFAFIVGLIPLVRATGPGAIGNRTIGTAAAGGMLVGTLLGVLIIPGLYYLFGKIADKEKLIRDQEHEPLSETFGHEAGDARYRDLLERFAATTVVPYPESPSGVAETTPAGELPSSDQPGELIPARDPSVF
jgi:HAE1 family hydrophobic/amphiphilic exporter-1